MDPLDKTSQEMVQERAWRRLDARPLVKTMMKRYFLLFLYNV